MTTEEFNQQVQQILQLASNKEAFFKLCDLYVIASDKQRKEIRQNYFFERDWEAPDHHSLAANLPGEPDREARIRASLILLSFSASDDFRDNLVTVAVVWNSLKDIGKMQMPGSAILLIFLQRRRHLRWPTLLLDGQKRKSLRTGAASARSPNKELFTVAGSLMKRNSKD